jgi:hypothetical protein
MLIHTSNLTASFVCIFFRNMKVFKTYVKNWNKHKGCIDENYTMKESIKFCVGYVECMEYIGSMPSRNEVWDDEEGEVVHYGMVLSSETSIELDDTSLL